MTNLKGLKRETELISLVEELNGLIENGIIKDKSDFKKWLQTNRPGCRYCFNVLSGIVDTYMEFI
jgi:hypothetical protein